jgi:hypothetical protein
MYNSNPNQNEKIRSDFATRRKTTGPEQMPSEMAFGPISPESHPAIVCQQEHTTVSSLAGIDKASNPKDGQPC